MVNSNSKVHLRQKQTLSLWQKVAIGSGASALLIILLILVFKGAGVTEGNAATTGASDPSDAATSGGSGVAWSSATNVYSSNNSDAYASLSTSGGNRNSEYLEITGFGFSIPSTATIVGIVVNMEKAASNGSSVKDYNIYLTKNGSSNTGSDYSNTSDYWGTSDAVETYGGATDLWGTTWAYSDINSANFGLRVQASNYAGSSRTAYIDHVTIEVFYSIPITEGPGGITSNLSAWLDASANVTGTTSITEWGDLSGNDNDMTAGGSASPALEADYVNFNDAIDFDGTQEYLQASAGGYTDEVFMVIVPDDLVDYTLADQAIFTSNSSASTPCTFLSLGSSTSGLTNEVVAWGVGGSSTWRRGLTSTSVSSPAGKPLLINVNNNNGGSTTSIYVDQAQIANASNGSYQNAENDMAFRVGGNAYYWGGSYYDGKVAEVITYSGSLSSTDRIKVASYLAVKYGITISGNYVLSDGTTIWNATSNASYHNEVAAIARDDDSRLDQQISKSQYTDAAITMDKGGAFSNDYDAIIWGNDDGSLTMGTSNGSNNYPDASNRTWKVQVNGSPGTVSLTVDLAMLDMTGGAAGNYALLIDADGDFTSGATEHTSGAALSGDDLTFTGVSFTNGYYFTLAQEVYDPYPGGVSTSIEMWLMANADAYSDAGATTLSDDEDNVLVWNDQSGNSFDVASAGSSGTYPYLDAGSMNFNPSIKFDGGGNRHLASLSQPVDGDMTWYVVYKTRQTSGSSNFWTCPAIVGAENSGTTNDYSISQNAGKPFFKGTAGDNFGCESSTAFNDGDPVILGATRVQNASGTNYLYINGALADTYAADNNSLSDPSSVGIGNHDDPASGSQFDGRIAEVINFSTALSESDRNKIETYLAMKYGTSVAHDYVNTSGTTLWDYSDNTTYHNRMTGIGRDDETTLDQRQSRNHGATSVLTIGLGSIAATNQDNSNAFSANQSYVLVGDDNDDLTGENETDQGTTTNSEVIERRIARTWMLRESGTVGSLRLVFDLRTFPGVLQNAATYDYSELRLLIDADGVFASGAYSVSPTSYNYSVSDTSITFDYNFSTGLTYFSLGTLDESGSPLPVEFTHFDAIPSGARVELIWGTATETNNERFELERSADGLAWHRIATIKGAGNSINPLDYSYFDNSPLGGKSYYRLMQVDYDGKTDFSEIREVNRTLTEQVFQVETVYPNPFAESFTVDVLLSEDAKVVFDLLNTNGSVVRTESLIMGPEVGKYLFDNLAGLPSGSYVLRVQANGRALTKRLIKQ
ncbi:MAG: T9SS type A sorting domain-containing protein [Bacteroidetes bacterium]|nr:T9SS type A sorting domain-containing protein [Bacteroidota bacterium]